MDFMFHGSGGSDFLQFAKKKWVRSFDIQEFIILFFYPLPGSQFSLGNP